jgi:hypothetical protein
LALYFQFISRGVAACSLQDALIFIGPRAKTRTTFAGLLAGASEQFIGLDYQAKQIICDIWQMLGGGL